MQHWEKQSVMTLTCSSVIESRLLLTVENSLLAISNVTCAAAPPGSKAGRAFLREQRSQQRSQLQNYNKDLAVHSPITESKAERDTAMLQHPLLRNGSLHPSRMHFRVAC